MCILEMYSWEEEQVKKKKIILNYLEGFFGLWCLCRECSGGFISCANISLFQISHEMTIRQIISLKGLYVSFILGTATI